MVLSSLQEYTKGSVRPLVVQSITMGFL